MSTDDFSSILEFTRIIQLHKVFLLFLALLVLVGLVKIIQKLGLHLQMKFPKRRLLTLQVVTMITFFLYLFGGGTLTYIILDPPRELMLAIGGSAAVAIGFSLKDLVGSFISGIVLLFDRPFQVGDRVQFADTYGEIVSIGLRAVRIQTLDDSLVTIPNSKFFTDLVSSSNSGQLDMMVVVDFHVSLDADIDKAKELLYEIVVTSRFVFLKKPVKIVVSEVSIAERIAIRLSVKAYVFDVKYEKDFQSDVVTRTTAAFNEHGIERPRIHQRFSEGATEQGSADKL